MDVSVVQLLSAAVAGTLKIRCVFRSRAPRDGETERPDPVDITSVRRCHETRPVVSCHR